MDQMKARLAQMMAGMKAQMDQMKAQMKISMALKIQSYDETRAHKVAMVELVCKERFGMIWRWDSNKMFVLNCPTCGTP